MQKYAMGAFKSPYDIRTFTAKNTKAGHSGGKKWLVKDIEDQHSVGICTAISLTAYAKKIYGIKFSADFQYLCQKKFYDNPIYPSWQWGEGSSAFHSLKVGKNIGFLPEKEFTKWITEKDRKLPYHQYIEKLKAVPDSEIERLKQIASKYRLKAYAKVVVDRDAIADKIDESEAGVITRYVVGSEWWTHPIEPLRHPKKIISGHLVVDTNYTGNSFRIANSWGKNWADKGTAYRLHSQYKPTEAWIPFFEEVPEEIEEKIENRDSVIGKILDLIQQLIVLVLKLK